jgi:hypothetical protein
VTVTIPIRLESTLNVREHWSKRAKRAKEHRTVTKLGVRECMGRVGARRMRFVVALTRIAPRSLDGDNLQGSLKAVRDGVADALGVDDGDPLVTWNYSQRKGAPKQYAVEIQILVGGSE